MKPAPESTRSVIAIAGHPIHAMLISFPVAFLLAGLASDLAYWWSEDPFWARMSIWLIGAGFVMGSLASIAGTLDFLLVKEIRRHVTSWSHFIAAIMLVSLAAANWWLRVPNPEEMLLPWGLFMSGVTTLSIGTVGWFGGKLVFHHNVGGDTSDA
ncbi:MAG: hypothetical protein A3I66_13570 [Burkholderiales bacterium RIFCSPLOWO2_02_FULL_57_36]|nr:MAG: hypothetical protein A3I66_13570 [Burkholderiales bacterium RIFCSPLOWO2_02_FULL_57_36]